MNAILCIPRAGRNHHFRLICRVTCVEPKNALVRDDTAALVCRVWTGGPMIHDRRACRHAPVLIPLVMMLRCRRHMLPMSAQAPSRVSRKARAGFRLQASAER